jgi:hypothetical protein
MKASSPYSFYDFLFYSGSFLFSFYFYLYVPDDFLLRVFTAIMLVASTLLKLTLSSWFCIVVALKFSSPLLNYLGSLRCFSLESNRFNLLSLLSLRLGDLEAILYFSRLCLVGLISSTSRNILDSTFSVFFLKLPFTILS